MSESCETRVIPVTAMMKNGTYVHSGAQIELVNPWPTFAYRRHVDDKFILDAVAEKMTRDGLLSDGESVFQVMVSIEGRSFVTTEMETLKLHHDGSEQVIRLSPLDDSRSPMEQIIETDAVVTP